MRSSAQLTVEVPADATVFVNDIATRSVGTVRQYVSRGLAPGRAYTYNLRVEFVRDGETITQTRVVRLVGGRSETVVFDQSPRAVEEKQDRVASQPVETKLTVRVPAGADVYLSGKKSLATGTLRVFQTSKMAAGTAWENYTVRVELMRDGQRLTQQRQFTLHAGEQRELAFDFDAQPLIGSVAKVSR